MKKSAAIATVILALVLAALSVPDYAELTPESEFALFAIACHIEARDSIETALAKYKVFKLESACSHESISSDIRSDGAHVLKSEELGYEMIFTPHAEGEGFVWSCRATPEKLTPEPCREDT
ncbi:hypothetical protein R0137_03690 [Congregibacter brevis]|uniref:Uncharacterized protein n=1 Tax=Congregibacter brevis TaxID=3081201 RepID=A0ABZ0IF68_9GAMM|nr:hypothetical protein R0137_03690 [Congregibacter sp. IMCC45268]